MMHIIKLIIVREFLSRIRNKSFIIMTFVSPLIMIVIAGVVMYLNVQKEASITPIAVCDLSRQVVSELKNTEHLTFTDCTPLGVDQAKKYLLTDGYEGLLVIQSASESLPNRFEYYSENNPSLELVFSIEQSLEEILTRKNLERAQVDLNLIAQSKADINLEVFGTQGKASLKGLNEVKMAIGGALGYFIMMFIIIYGNMVMRSVIEEKNNRIVEIIISSVKPFYLMIGKILGTSLAGLLQFCIWLVCGFLLLMVLGIVAQPLLESQSGSASGIPPEIMNLSSELFDLPLATMGFSFLLFFLGGYLLYSSFYAAIGAAVDSETDSQQFLLPIISPLVLAVYVGFFTVINEPHGTVALVFSLVPFTSPIVMLMRIPFGVPFWQIGLSLTLLFSTFIAVVWMAGKIYRIGILSHGKKPTYKELIQWIKYY